MLNKLNIYGSGSGYSNIWIKDAAQRVILSNNYIGGYATPNSGVLRNLSSNSYSGIYINSSGNVAAGAARAWIYGNYVVCNKGVPGNGVDILTDKVIVGADAAGQAHFNYIEANQQHGIRIEGSAASDNVIRDSNLGPNQNGVVITGSAHSNRVLTNSIGSNTNLGVWLGGGAYTDSAGNWSISDPAFTGCYVGFTTETSLLGTGSTEFSRTNCSLFLPLISKSF